MGERTEERAPRVCLVTPTFYPIVGGGETHARLLASSMNAIGAHTFVLTRRVYASMPGTDEVDGVATYRLPPSGMGSLGKYATAPLLYHELVRRRDEYDAILVCSLTVFGLPAVQAARRLGKVCVLRAESMGEMSGDYASAHGAMKPAVGPLFARWIAWRNVQLRKADACVSICGPITREFESCGIPRERIAAIPNGVNLQRFHPCAPGERSTVREKLGLPEARPVAMYTGKLNHGKGLECLLRAWTRVSKERPDALLVLVGSGGGQSISCEAGLREFVRSKGLTSSVVFTGYVQNVDEYLRAADLFVFPTEYEAFGLSLVEAMSCGLPVIASRVGGIPEVVEDGVTGKLLEPHDHTAFAVEILRALSDPEATRTTALAGRRAVRDRYSIDVVATRYRSLLISLCSDRSIA